MPHNLELDEAPPCGKGHEFRQSNKCIRSSQALFTSTLQLTRSNSCSGRCPRRSLVYDAAARNTYQSLISAAQERLHGSTL